MCREGFASGEGIGNVVLGMSVVPSMSLILNLRLGLACRVTLDSVRGILGMLLLGFNSASWFLDLSIGSLLH